MKVIFTALFLFILLQPIFAGKLGRFMRVSGEAVKMSIETGEIFDITAGSELFAGQKIKTGENSTVEVLLNDGTGILIKEATSLDFYGILNVRGSPAMILQLRYGKVNISLKNPNNQIPLILKTPAAIACNYSADFSAIASEYETRILVYRNRMAMMGTGPQAKKIIMLFPEEEVSVVRGRGTLGPVKTQFEIMSWWLDFYEVVDNHRKIVRKDRDSSYLDWIIRKRSF